jgi:hypothetical protein
MINRFIKDPAYSALQLLGSEPFIGWNLNQPNGHAIIKYWFIEEWSSWGTSTGSHAVNQFQKLQPISGSRPAVDI